MKLKASELPKASSLSDEDLRNRIRRAHELLLAPVRPEAYRKLSRSAWEREKSQTRFWVGVWSELLMLRAEMRRMQRDRVEQPLREPVCGFDSELLTPAELKAACSVAVLISEAELAKNGGTEARIRAVSTLPLLSTICEERRNAR